MTELFNQFAYQIKRTSDGLFSRGGHQPIFSKKGKIWKTKSALNSHLRYYFRRSMVYNDCVIIENEMVDGNIVSTEYDLEKWIKDLEIDHDNKEQSKRVSIKSKLLGYEIYNVDLDNNDKIVRVYITKGNVCKSFPVNLNHQSLIDENT